MTTTAKESKERFTEKQFEALKLLGGPAQHIMLFGGSRSGKTFTLVSAIVARALKAPGGRHAIIRFRQNSVRQSVGMDTLPKVVRCLYPWTRYRQNKSDGIFFLPNGSEIWLVGLDDDARVEKILGKEFVTMYFNECSEISFDAVQMALTRLAQNVPGLTNKVYYDCNPAGKSHWSFRQFIQHINPLSREALTNPEDYVSLLMNPGDNRKNLPDGYIENTLSNLSSRQRQRFLEGKWLDDAEGALWTQSMIDNARVNCAPDVYRVVVAIDPAVTADEGSDHTGTVAAAQGVNGEYYILEDASIKASPVSWGKRAIALYHKYDADRVVGETNNGGDLIENLLRQIDPSVPYRKVVASRGKTTRAEPIAALYEKGIVHHVGVLPDLEDEMTGFVPLVSPKSPDRMDAMVWAMTELARGGSRAIIA